VTHRRALVVAILLYVTLDLSSPAMPGAFVFDTMDSVESAHTRARAASERVMLAPPVRDPFVLARPLLDLRDQPRPAESVEREWRPVLPRHARARLDSAPPAEDPH
jgi:hypothetical protein